MKGVSEIDPDFGTKLMEIIVNGPPVNGDTYGIDEIYPPTENGCLEANGAQSDGEAPDVPEEPIEAPVVQDVPVEIAAAS